MINETKKMVKNYAENQGTDNPIVNEEEEMAQL